MVERSNSNITSIASSTSSIIVLDSPQKDSLDVKKEVPVIDLVSSSDESEQEPDIIQTTLDICSQHQANIHNYLSSFGVSLETHSFGPELESVSPKCLNPKYSLKHYQNVGLAWLISLYNLGLGGILADDMGLGKTAQIIAFLAYLIESHPGQGPNLIIVPASILDNWIREITNWCPTLRLVVYRGSQDERAQQRFELQRSTDDYDVLLTTYNTASSKEDRSFFRKIRLNCLLLDEGHLLKNSKSARYKFLVTLRAKFRFIITGTPLQNDLKELIAILSFMLPSIFANEDIIYYFESKASSAEDAAERIAAAKKMMDPFVLRRSKDMVIDELPKKINTVEYSSFSERQSEVYNKILNQDLSDKDRNFLSNILMQLRKASNHPLLIRRYDLSHFLAFLIRPACSPTIDWPIWRPLLKRYPNSKNQTRHIFMKT